MKRVAKFCVLAAVIAVGAPTSARAEGYVSPWAGVQFGSDVDNGRGGFGVNAGGMGAGIIGGEVGFGFSPSFFGSKNEFGNNTVLDLMGNVIVGIPVGGTRGGGFRPFVTGGLGLIRTIDGGNVFNVVELEQSFRLQPRRRSDGVLQQSRRHARRCALPAHPERRRRRPS